MSRREATFRRKSISLTAQILLIQMMIRWWDRLNGFRTIRSRSHVLSVAKTDMMLKDFEGVVSPAVGALCVDLTIGSKTLPTTFFVINGKRLDSCQLLHTIYYASMPYTMDRRCCGSCCCRFVIQYCISRNL